MLSLHFAWGVHDAKCIVVTRVCLSVCVPVGGCMPTLLHGPGCNLGGMVGVTPSCALLGGFAIGARVALLWQHSANTKCQWVFVLTLCLVVNFWHLAFCSLSKKLKKTVPFFSVTLKWLFPLSILKKQDNFFEWQIWQITMACCILHCVPKSVDHGGSFIKS